MSSKRSAAFSATLIHFPYRSTVTPILAWPSCCWTLDLAQEVGDAVHLSAGGEGWQERDRAQTRRTT